MEHYKFDSLECSSGYSLSWIRSREVVKWTKTISPSVMKSKNSSSNPSFPFGLKDLIPYIITDKENGFLFRVPKPNWKKKVYSVLASTKLLDQMICILSFINDSIISTNVISEVTSFFEEQVCFRNVKLFGYSPFCHASSININHQAVELWIQDFSSNNLRAQHT